MNIKEILVKKSSGLVSVDFNQDFVKISYLKSSGEGFLLSNYDFKKISSLEEDRAEIANFINNFLKNNSILEKQVYLTVYEPDAIVIKYLILPLLPKEEVPQAIKWQLQTDSSLDPVNSIFDWQVVKEFTDTEGAQKNGIICALAKPEAINKYTPILLNDCGLLPLRISTSHFNYANILRYLQASPSIVAVLDIGRRDTTLCIYKNSKLNFIRVLGFSSEKLTQSLTGTLVSDRGKLEITPEKAEEIRNNFGIPKDGSTLLQDNILGIHIISLMRPVLENLAREIKRSFIYFASNFQEESPPTLYITGDGANLKNLDWYLNKELTVNVALLPLPNFISLPEALRDKFQQEQNQIMSSIGATLADSADINLAPAEIKAHKIELWEKVSLRIGAVVLGVILLFSLFMMKFQIYDYNKRLKNAKAHLEAVGFIKNLKQKIDARHTLIKKIQKDRVNVEGVLKLLSAIIPNEIVLNELVFEQGKHTLVLRGVASGSEENAETALTDFIQKCEASSFLKEATLLSSRNIGGVLEFEIRCDVAY